MTTPIYFVCHKIADWQDLVDSARAVSPDECPQRFVSGIEAWIVQTWLRLKARGHDVRLVPHLVPGEICVVHFDNLLNEPRSFASYVVAVRADRPPIAEAEHVIEQNPASFSQSESARVSYLPHWPQPGLVPRREERGSRISRVAFFGRSEHLAPRFQNPAFHEELSRRGIEFSLRESDWHSYSDIDVVLAVRDLTPQHMNVKPPTKLFNSWLAGCPALLGPESAYRALRRSELDFCEVESAEDVFRALDRLQSDPQLFSDMIANGRERARACNVDAVTREWETFFQSAVLPGFSRWRRALRVKMPFYALRFRRRARHQDQMRAVFRQQAYGVEPSKTPRASSPGSGASALTSGESSQ